MPNIITKLTIVDSSLSALEPALAMSYPILPLTVIGWAINPLAFSGAYPLTLAIKSTFIAALVDTGKGVRGDALLPGCLHLGNAGDGNELGLVG
jgi:hypothetical protein